MASLFLLILLIVYFYWLLFAAGCFVVDQQWFNFLLAIQPIRFGRLKATYFLTRNLYFNNVLFLLEILFLMRKIQG